MPFLQSAFGLLVFVAIAWAISEDRRAASVRVAVAGIAAQLLLAALLLKLPPLASALAALNDLVLTLQQATDAGTSFVFGYLGGGPLPFEETQPGASFVLAFRALPLTIVVSALTAVLTYWRILPWIVRGFALGLEKTLGVGGAVGLGAAANVFIGMVEAPLFIRPYLATLSRSELFVIMASGNGDHRRYRAGALRHHHRTGDTERGRAPADGLFHQRPGSSNRRTTDDPANHRIYGRSTDPRSRC